jgi:K+-transporting ATPase ATPase C chain
MATPITRTAARQAWAALRMTLVMTALLGLVYPLVMTGFAQIAFAGRADGSLVERAGSPVGSALVGQSFDGRPEYFQSRPSAAGEGYDPLASGASNLGPENRDLLTAIAERRAAVAELDGTSAAEVAPDALLASGSGLDPDISPEYAAQQVPRVSRERDMSARQVRGLVDRHTEGRALGFLGEPHVNVVQLNLALDAADGQAD